MNLASVKPISCAIDNCKSESDMAEKQQYLTAKVIKALFNSFGSQAKIIPKARENHKSSSENAVNKHF